MATYNVGDYESIVYDSTTDTDVGVTNTGAEVSPWNQSEGIDYWIDDTQYSYAGEDNDGKIKVDKGNPSNSKYAIFYAVEVDPVIFVNSKRELQKELRKLMKRPEVDKESIRIFKLVGGSRDA